MSRKPLGQLILTDDEFAWVARTIARKALISEKSTQPALKAMVKKFAAKIEQLQLPDASKPVILPTSRQEARFLQAVANNILAMTLTKVIPEYQQRAASDPEKYKKYLAGAIQVKDVCESIVNKVGKVL